MSNIAVIKLGGSQHLVYPGDKLEVNRLKTEEGQEIFLDTLLSSRGDDLLLNEGEVKAKVLAHKLGKKLHIVKFRAKSRYRRKKGHRQHLTVVEILSINGETKSPKEVKDVELSSEIQTSAKKGRKS